MTSTIKTKTMLIWLAAYEAAHELRKEAEEENSEEQQKEIAPIFSEAFPELASKGIAYKESWKLDIEPAINEWEEKNRISEICDRIANKHKGRINALMQSEREAEINLCNSALDILEVDAKGSLTSEQMRTFREKVNSSSSSCERRKMCEYIVDFAADKRKKK